MYYLKLTLFFVILQFFLTSSQHQQCGLYGAPPCTFLPAPPGSTPTCAGPGRTYCEHVEHYPLQLIKHLIERWGYDFQRLLTDETTDEFDALRLRQPQFYGPALVYGPPPSQVYRPQQLPPPQQFPQQQQPQQPQQQQVPLIRPPQQQPSIPSPPPPPPPPIPQPPQQIIPQQNIYSATDGYKYPNPNNGINYNIKAPSHGYSNTAGFYNQGAYAQSIFNVPRPIENQPINKNNFNHGNNNNLYPGAYLTAVNNFQQSQFQRATIGGAFPKNGNFYLEQQQITEYNPSQWLKRYSRDLTKKYKFPISEIDQQSSTVLLNDEPDILEKSNDTVSEKQTLISENNIFLNGDLYQNSSSKNKTTRQKRQSAGRQALCQINTQYIQPQAALNSRGNWMYVVNQPEPTATQLVKTETCASTVCSNLCQVPNGYNSRCEQKYVQKRLIALDSNGQNLYTDTFWFPSCCVCTISNQ